MQAPWWSRTWTVQEFVLARKATFHCGAHTFDSAILIQCTWHLARHDLGICHCGLTLDWLVMLSIVFGPCDPSTRLKVYRRNFLECVGDLRFRRASDPRDKIYGLLGLGANSNSSLVQPDYSLLVEEVYEQFVLSLLNTTKNLDFLGHIKTGQKGDLPLPSFIPDWDCKPREPPKWSPRPTLFGLYSASNGSEAVFKAMSGVLYIQGTIFDTVQRIASVSLTDSSTFRADPKVLDELFDIARIPPKHLDAGDRHRQRFWSTMCAGVMMKKEYLPSRFDELSDLKLISAHYERLRDISSDRFENYERFLRSLADGKKETWADGMNKLSDRHLNKAVGDANLYRRGMATERGSFGLIPMEARVGDVVAILTGGRVPIILRPEAGYYTVFGDEYVHEIMDGEGMQDVKELDWIELH